MLTIVSNSDGVTKIEKFRERHESPVLSITGSFNREAMQIKDSQTKSDRFCGLTSTFNFNDTAYFLFARSISMYYVSLIV